MLKEAKEIFSQWGYTLWLSGALSYNGINLVTPTFWAIVIPTICLVYLSQILIKQNN